MLEKDGFRFREVDQLWSINSVVFTHENRGLALVETRFPIDDCFFHVCDMEKDEYGLLDLCKRSQFPLRRDAQAYFYEELGRRFVGTAVLVERAID